MINVKDKTCQEEGCNTQPHFNLPTESKGIYCAVHKKENMIDMMNRSDRKR